MVKRKRPTASSRVSSSPAKSDSQSRLYQNRLWLYGLHAVTAALNNPARRKWRLVATENGANHLSEAVAKAGLTPEIAKADAIARLLPANAVHQGAALAVTPLPDIDLQTLITGQQSEARQILCILDQVTDPHNVGAVLRSCAAFGAVALIVTGRNAASETAVLAKSASGALEHVPMIRVTNLARTMDQLATAGFWRIGLDSAAQTPLADAPLEGNIALVLGAEGSGIRTLTQKKCDHLVRLPTDASFPSLNVSNAAAIALYAAATAKR